MLDAREPAAPTVTSCVLQIRRPPYARNPMEGVPACCREPDGRAPVCAIRDEVNVALAVRSCHNTAIGTRARGVHARRPDGRPIVRRFPRQPVTVPGDAPRGVAKSRIRQIHERLSPDLSSGRQTTHRQWASINHWSAGGSTSQKSHVVRAKILRPGHGTGEQPGFLLGSCAGVVARSTALLRRTSDDVVHRLCFFSSR